jgi:polyisoprenoid-binding protein YceI
MRTAIALLLGILGFPVAAEVHRLDADTTLAEFSLRVVWVRKLEGQFTHIEGEITRETDRPGFSVDVRIAAESLQMHNPAYARWARSAEFFDAERHPWIRFHATDLREAVLVDGGQLRGKLELRGQTRPQVLDIAPAGCDRPGLDCAVIATAELRRSEFGMDSRKMSVADKVRLRLAIRLRE